MNRRDFMARSAAGACGAWWAGQGAAGALEAAPGAARRPNIVVLLADDLGYGELGAYGGTEIPTPHIDAIARGGVRLTQGYVSCPVCSPTRAGLLTGRYQQRFGHEFNPGPEHLAAPNFGLPLSETTLADRLRAAGYATGAVGKWHLGYRPELNPARRGFDEYYGFLAGARSYLPGAADAGTRMLRGADPAPEDFAYTTEAFAREASAYIERNAARPFFAYVAFNAVHGPLETLDRYRDRFPALSGKRQTFAAMLSALDDGVGAILGTLERIGLRDDTLVFFLSDNGGPTAQITSGNGPLRDQKGTVYEGGIRVPFLVQWPRALPAGAVYAQPAIALDILPTALAAAGVPIDPAWQIDGVDLAPHLAGANPAPPHAALHWRYGAQHAVREGDWKLMTGPGGAEALYHLAGDPGEQHDRLDAEPEVAARLRGLHTLWNAGLAPPAWQTAAGRRAAKART